MSRVMLFAYGTLMRGEPAHGLLGDARWIVDAHTEPAFTLLNMGEYPALLEGGSTRVAGEIYEIDASLLEALDRYEEAPAVYARRVLRIGAYDALAYVLKLEHAAQRVVIASGDWRSR